MKIAIDISPLQNGHKYRGTGFYVLHLKEAFEVYFSKEHEFFYFTDLALIPKDVDIIHYPYFDPFSLSVPGNFSKKTFVTVLDLTPIIFSKHFPAGIKGNIKWQIQKIRLKKIAGIITDSQSAGNDIEKIVGINKNKIHITHLAAGENFTSAKISESSKNQIRKKYNLPENFTLYVGDVTWNKNVPRIIEAAIRAKVPLVIAGKAIQNTSYDRKNVWNKDLIRAQELIKTNSNIFVLGFVPDEDLVALYYMATVFVMPSLYEGFGLPILEAMSCNCPVITSKAGSLAEVAGDSAFFVDAENTESIASGIISVFNNPKLQKDLSEKGIINAKKFSWKKTAEETMRAYENL